MTHVNNISNDEDQYHPNDSSFLRICFFTK